MQSSSNLASVIAGKKPFAMAFLLACLLMPGCQETAILFGEDDEPVSRQVSLEAYRSVWTYGLFEISLIQDTVNKAVVKGKASMVKNIHFKQEGGKVTVTEEKSNHWDQSGEKPLLEFHFRNLNYFRIEEPSRLYSRDTLHTNKLEVIVANELSEIDLLIDAGYFYLENWTTSTGKYTLKGLCREFEMKLCGSGTLEARGLKAKNADITQQSLGDGYITVSDTLKVHSSGQGHIYYDGNPRKVIFTQQASGELIPLQ